MVFRDQPTGCPQCGVSLVRYAGRDKWRCRDCSGVLVGGEELSLELGESRARELLACAPGAPRAAPYGCPVCTAPMTPFSLGAYELDRCDRHRVVWFDAGELGKVRALPGDEAQPEMHAYLAALARDD